MWLGEIDELAAPDNEAATKTKVTARQHRIMLKSYLFDNKPSENHDSGHLINPKIYLNFLPKDLDINRTYHHNSPEHQPNHKARTCHAKHLPDFATSPVP